MPRVGFGRVDITPELGLPMVGMPGSPRGEGVVWPLHGRVLLADDGQRRVAIGCFDLIALTSDAVAELRTRLAGPGGLPAENILIACSHTHRAPLAAVGETTTANPILAADDGEARKFLDEVAARVSAAMAEAAAGMQPATLSAGRALAPGWAFNRRPIYANGDVGTHGWAWEEDFVRMEGTPDEEITVLVARGPDGDTLGGLVGFACHPTAMGHDAVYSADYAGALTEALEAQHGGTFGFVLGAAADSSTPDPTSRDAESGFGREHASAMGRALAGKAEEAIASSQPLRSDRVGVASTRVAIAQRQPTPEQVELARWYLGERPDDLDEEVFTRQLYGHSYTFRDGQQTGNERHAEELLRMWEWQQGPDAQLVEQLEIQAVALGETAIVGLPVELFTEFGRRIKAASPFAQTFIATLANGWHGYVPTAEAFSRGGYEPRFAYPSRLAEEAGDIITAAAIALLQRLAAPSL